LTITSGAFSLELLQAEDIQLLFIADREEQRMKQQSENTRQGTDHGSHQAQDVRQPVPPLPTVGPPLDGRQYQDVVEEQKYAERRPSREEQQPHRANEGKAH
jgi:hypothetical protein